jgi:hypothetical protein
MRIPVISPPPSGAIARDVGWNCSLPPTTLPSSFPEKLFGKCPREGFVSQERLSHCADRRAKIAFAVLMFRALNEKKSFDKAKAG